MIAVGRLRPPFQDDVEHYRKLIAGLARVELIEVREDERVPPRIPGARAPRPASQRRQGVRLDRVQRVARGAPAGRPRPLLRDRWAARARPRKLRHAPVARAASRCRTSSPGWCSSSSSTGPTRSSRASRITISRGMDPVAHLTTAVEETATDLAGNGRRAGLKLDRPPRPDFGDYSTNAAMLLAPTMGEPPRAIAEKLASGSASGSARPSSGWRSRGRASSTCSWPTAGTSTRSPTLLEAGEEYGAGIRRRAREPRVREREPDRADDDRLGAPRGVRRRPGAHPRAGRATASSASTT